MAASKALGRPIYEKLLEALWSAPQESTFAYGGQITSPQLLEQLPKKLSINGVGTITLPLSLEDASGIRLVSSQAPYGKGQDTIIDTSVRKAWQVDAGQIAFPENPNFLTETASNLVSEALSNMGLNSSALQPQVKLYKLLMYDQCGHFKFHRDTEKEDGMFATMVLQLPVQSGHKGGVLTVRHEGISRNFDFETDSSSGYFYTTFFADCEHELVEVTEGTRLCLVFSLLRYNLEMVPVDIRSPSFLQALVKVEEHLLPWIKSLEENFNSAQNKQLIIPLSYMYSEKSLSFAGLKGHDRVVAELLRSCGGGVLDLHLGILTKYKQVSDPEYGGWVQQKYEVTNCIAIEGSAERKLDLVFKDVESADIVRVVDKDQNDNEPFGEEPDEKTYTGFMGNEGAWTEYWYRVAALLVWPRCKRVQALACSSKPEAAVEALERGLPSLTPGGLKEAIAFLCSRKVNDSVVNSLLRLCIEGGFQESALAVIERLVNLNKWSGPPVNEEVAKAVVAYGSEAILKIYIAAFGKDLEGETHARLAFALESIGSHDEAVIHLNKALNVPIYKKDFKFKTSLFVLLLSQGREDLLGSLKTFDKLVEVVIKMEKAAGLVSIDDSLKQKVYLLGLKNEELRRQFVAYGCPYEAFLRDLPYEAEQFVVSCLRNGGKQVLESLAEVVMEEQSMLSKVVENEKITSSVPKGGPGSEVLKMLIKKRLEYLGVEPKYDYEQEAKRLKLQHHRKARAEFAKRKEQWEQEREGITRLLAALAALAA